MQFLSPYFLWTLLALAIPIIIHLFNFRKYKKVYFTNVKLFTELQKDNRTRNKLKNYLILAARLLALACLILAFAQPYFPNKNNSTVQGAKNYVSIYIDNSLSMEANEKQGTLLDASKRKALEIIDAYSEADKFQLLTNEFAGTQQHLFNKEDAKAAVYNLQLNASTQTLANVISRQQSALASVKGNKHAYLVSDFQTNTLPNTVTSMDTTITWTLLPIQNTNIPNVYIDTAYFKTPTHRIGSAEELVVKITNVSSTTIEALTVNLKLNGTQVALGTATIAPNASTLVTLTYTNRVANWNTGVLSIKDFPITFDNTLNIAYNVVNTSNVAIISATPNNDVVRAYAQDDYFKITNYTPTTINYAQLRSNDVIVLDELTELSSGIISELQTAVNNGGVLVVFPAANANIANYNTLLSNLGAGAFTSIDTNKLTLKDINTNASLLAGVFEKNNVSNKTNWPAINYHYKYTSTASGAQQLLSLTNNDTYLQQHKHNKGQVYIFTAPHSAQYTTVSAHALFLPLLYQMAFSAANNARLYSSIGNLSTVVIDTLAAGESNIHLQLNDSLDIVPEQQKTQGGTQLLLNNELLQNGIYKVMLNNKILSYIALNATTTESVLTYYTPTQLNEVLHNNNPSATINVLNETSANVTTAIHTATTGRKLWLYFIAAALLFLLCEIVIIQFWNYKRK
ncbi:MAG: BatA domain-containing protein [Bacteroidia bacterium]